MLPCPSCDRHVRGDERACPFCAEPLRSAPVRRIPAAAIVIAVGSVLAACGPAVSDAGDTIETSSGEGTTDQADATTGGAVGSTSTTGVPGTTDPTMAMSTSTSLGEDGTGSSTTFVDDTMDTACGFYGGCPVDGGGVSYECDLFMQDCPDGEKCMPWANDGGDIWNAARCTPLAPTPIEVGDPCFVEGSGVSGVDNCAEGAMCFYVDPEANEGVCLEMCGGEEETPVCLQGTCIVQFDGALPLCFVTCEPEDPTCAKTEACEPVLDETVETEVCTPT